MNILKCLLMYFFLFLVLIVAQGKEENEKDPSSHFRMQKHNLLWDKAKKNLGKSPKLEKLYSEISKLDKLTLKLKHMENKHTKEAKLLEEDTKEMYMEILNNYGLATNRVDNENQNNIRAKFSDKVEKLWQSAINSGKFSSGELDDLQKEFKHHEKNIEDYRQAADMILEHDAISDNDIRSVEKMSEIEMKKFRKDLKMKHHHLTTGFLELQRKVKDRVLDVEGDFTDVRVVELWERAKKTGFSKQELDSVKQELKHFQIRIDKHNYWKDRHAKLSEDVNDGHIMEPDDYDKIQGKVKEHARLVKKYHATMLDRVERRDEL